MSTIFSILRESAREKNGYFDGIEIRTKSGVNHSGTLAKWRPDGTSQVVGLVYDNNEMVYIDIGSIESVRIVNPA